ncbi:hypothetical protein V7124_09535 [Neobacillus niacini]|uniref:hypothetical protein n=1 Tax=Neobacillus niacini TaxID=86668 RepID=UPI002FFFD349
MIKIKVVLKERMFGLGTSLICAEGTKTPAGVRGWGDPAGALAPRRLPGPPAESEVRGAQINSQVNTAITTKR